MKKSVLFSFFALLLAAFGFGGISMAITVDYYPSVESSTFCEHNISRYNYQNITLYSYNNTFHTNCPSADSEGILVGYKIFSEGCDGGWTYALDSNVFTLGTEGQSFNVSEGSSFRIENNKNSCVIKAYALLNTGITNISLSGSTLINAGEDFDEVITVDNIADFNADVSGYNFGEYSFVKKDNNNWIDVTEETAVAGINYGVKVSLNIYSGFVLSDSPSFTYNGTIIENPLFDLSGETIYVYIDLGVVEVPTELTEISEIRFNGPESVFSGQNLAVVLQISNVDDIDLSGYNFWVYTGVKKDGDNWVALDSTETVAVLGTHYGMKVPITIESGFVLSDTPSFTYNGTIIENPLFDLSGETKYVYIDLGVALEPDPIPVESVDFTGIVFPVVGKTMFGELVRIQSVQKSLKPDIYRIVDYHFYLGSGDQWIKMDEDDVFIARTGYKLDFLVELNDKILYSFVDLLTGTMNGVYFDDLNISGDQVVLSKLFTPIFVVETTPAPAVSGGGSGGGSGSPASTAANTNTNAETKAVEKPDDANLNPNINELIMTDYLREELENNKELYKNAPLKVFVALYNLKKYDIFSLKQTAEAYKNASVAGRQKCLSLLSSFSKGDSKRAKYVSDYFKFIAGIN